MLAALLFLLLVALAAVAYTVSVQDYCGVYATQWVAVKVAAHAITEAYHLLWCVWTTTRGRDG